MEEIDTIEELLSLKKDLKNTSYVKPLGFKRNKESHRLACGYVKKIS